MSMCVDVYGRWCKYALVYICVFVYVRVANCNNICLCQQMNASAHALPSSNKMKLAWHKHIRFGLRGSRLKTVLIYPSNNNNISKATVAQTNPDTYQIRW